ncbi:MAG: hypothetical protein Q9209_004980 [Squamulea sp. 1 TL-2023]
MSFFSLIQRKGSKPIPPAPNSIRKEVVHSSTTKKTLVLNNPHPRPVLPASRRKGQVVIKDRTKTTVEQQLRKRKQPQQSRLVSDSDSEESDFSTEVPKKRPKLNNGARTSTRRQLRSVTAFSEGEDGIFPMVHASDIAALDKPINFNLVEPLQSDDFKPLDDIKETMEVTVDHYLPPADAAFLKDDSHGLLRRLRRARDKKDGAAYKSVVLEWNDAIMKARIDGRIANVLDDATELDLRLIERILTQTYARTVSPRVSTLRQYENGTDNVYGELLPKFVSDIFRVTGLGPSHVFVDLGSGVGNVVLQAALEVGCESWGCEIMENACVLADLQEPEFKARCRLWGLTVGDINLQRGDFLENQRINQVLPKADVILVNNQAFTPELNDRLTSHFLDLKEGCQVVSLKSFVPAGHRITSRNLNSAYNVLDVVERRYYSACVSWTDAPGSYYISRKDSAQLQAFSAQNARA